VGVTEEVAEAVKSSVAVTLKALGDFPALGEIIKNVTEGTGQYIGKHTMLLTNVSCAIACAMDWYSEATFEKLTLAAFMHDAALTDSGLCAVKDLGEFEKVYKGKYNQGQISEYRSHPERAVLLLGHFKVMPAEVDKIVAQHHEHPMGSGFPAALSSNYLTPLSSLFIIAHDLTDYILDHPNDFNMDHFLDAFEKKYSVGHFKKIAKVLGSVEIFPEAT
jgi:HD-GYP domain-containing protein (c-di-GMP phosphodiesterase class II)